MDRAGVVLSCGPGVIIVRVTGPQTSYRGEPQCAVFVTAPSIAEPADNRSVVRWPPDPPNWECAEMDLLQQITDHLETRLVPFCWIPSHGDLWDATSPEYCEAILHNDEVDKWAKIATALRLPPCDPTAPFAVVFCGAIAPSSAKKWVLQCRRTCGFPGVH